MFLFFLLLLLAGGVCSSSDKDGHFVVDQVACFLGFLFFSSSVVFTFVLDSDKLCVIKQHVSVGFAAVVTLAAILLWTIPMKTIPGCSAPCLGAVSCCRECVQVLLLN